MTLKALLAALLQRRPATPPAGPALDQQGNPHELVLYKFNACPYCQKVMDYLKQHPLPLTYKDIRQEPALREELVSLGGKGQVPCLVVDGTPMYESDEIVKYLKNF